MRKHKIKILLYLLFLPAFAIRAQVSTDGEINFLHGKLFLGSEAGANWGVFDDDHPTLNANARFTLEYSLFNWKNHSLGLKQFFGAGNLRNMNPDLQNQKFESDQFNIGIGAVHSFSVAENLYPYTMFGVTSFIVNNKTGSYQLNEVNFSFEAGFKLLAIDNLVINVNGSVNIGNNEVLNNILPGEQDKVSYAANLGISYGIGLFSFSSEDFVANEPETNTTGLSSIGPVIDSDNDGVADTFDKCPNTPDFLKVDSSGCPLDSDLDGVPDYVDQCSNTQPNLIVDSFGCPIDSDEDGVPDYLDKCPDSNFGIEVDENGCSLDDDSDGVPNEMDQCPGTELGIKVDSVGCEIKEVIEFKEIIRTFYFEYDKTKFADSNFRKILEELLAEMKKNPKSVWRIAGHCDGFEATDSAKNIAYDRAKYLQDYFVNNGIQKSQIETFDMGSEYPVESNLTIAGRAKNRRAIIMRIE